MNINMKNLLKFFVVVTPLFLIGVFFVTKNVDASVLDYQISTLSSGWNIVSTPKVLLSHEFSVTETSSNFDIYLLDPTTPSGWQTMQGAGQTEFKPLFAYFINNKTGQNQTLKFNYNLNLTPAQRLFQRTLSPGWNTVGIASPSYALPQGSTASDTNNPSNILSSVVNSIAQVIDFTNSNTNLDSPSISGTWLSKTVTDANTLNDFRELKGYGIFVTSATNNYLGSQNLQVLDGIAPVITLNGNATVNILVGDTYIDAGATALDNIDGDITSSIVITSPANMSTAGTYTITYNVSDSSGNHAQQVTRTVIVGLVPGSVTVTVDPSFNTTNISGGSVNVVIAKYLLQATGEDMKITSLVVTPTITNGTPNTTNVDNVTLYFNGSQIGSTQNINTALIYNLGSQLIIPSGMTKTLEVRADITNYTAGSLTVNLAGSLGNVQGCTTLNISTAPSISGINSPNLTITVGSIINPPTMVTASSTAQQFVAAAGGADSATKATFKLLASGGAVTVTELKLTVNSQDLSTASTDADAGSTGSQALTVTSRTGFALGDVVELVGTTNGYGTITGGTGTGAGALTVYITTASTGTPTAVRLIPATVTSIKVGTVTAPVVAGVAYLTGLNLSVPNGTSGLAIDAYVSYAPVGMNGIMSGATSRVALEYVKYSGGNGTSTLCTTAISASCTAPLSSAVSAPTMKVVGSRPTLALASSGGVLVQGTTDVGTITVTADTKGDVVLTDLPISVGVTDATLTNANPGYNADGIRVKDAQGNLVTTTNTQFSTTTTGGNSTITFTNGYTIPAGTSASFHIYLYFATAPNTNGAHTSAATLSLGSSSLLSWTDTAGNALTTTGVDVIGSAATTTSNKYLYGTTVPGFFYNYPTNTVSVSS